MTINLYDCRSRLIDSLVGSGAQMKNELFEAILEHVVGGCVDNRCDPNDGTGFSEHLTEVILEVLEESA